jgi:hypothetical protein
MLLVSSRNYLLGESTWSLLNMEVLPPGSKLTLLSHFKSIIGGSSVLKINFSTLGFKQKYKQEKKSSP